MFSTIGHAQAAENAETKSTLSVTPSFGGYLFASSQDLHATPIYGIKLNYDIYGYFITDALGVEAAGDYFSTTTKSSGEKATGYLLRADALYSLFPRNKWTPYLLLGLGGLFMDKGSSREQDPLLNYGVGLKYLLTDYLAVRVEARYVAVYSTVTPRTNFEISSGLTYLFGKRKSKPAAPTAKAVPELTETSRLTAGAPKRPEPPKPTESMEKLGVMGAAGFTPTAPVFQGEAAAKPKGELPLAFQGAQPIRAQQEEVPVQGAPAEQTLQKPEASAPPAAPALPAETPLPPEKQAPDQPAAPDAATPVAPPAQTPAPTAAPLKPEAKAPAAPAAPSAPAPVASPAQITAPAEAPLKPEAKVPATPAAPSAPVPVTSPAQVPAPAPAPLQPEAKVPAQQKAPTEPTPVDPPTQVPVPVPVPAPVDSPAQAPVPAPAPLKPEAKVPATPAAPTAPVPVEPPAPAALPPLTAEPAPETKAAPSTRPARPLKSVVVEFAFNSFVVQPKYAKDLVMVAALMNGDPEATIEIAGHTDNVGGKRHNYLLSLKRAESVKRQLVKYGVSPKRIATRGYGFSQPTAENGSEQGRQRNRRAVAVIIYLKEP